MILLFLSTIVFIIKLGVAIILALFILNFILGAGKGNSKKLGSGQIKPTKLLGMGNDYDGLVIDGRKAISAKNSFQHLLLCSPTGKGKSTTHILPSIFNVKGSIVCTDLKGELYTLTSGYLRSIGYDVKLLDMSNVYYSMRYNPFDRVRTEADVKRLASAFYHMSNAGTKGTDAIWSQGAINVLELLINALLSFGDRSYLNMANYLRMFSYLIDGRLKSFIEKYGDEDLKRKYTSFKKLDKRIQDGQLGSALACMVPFDLDESKIITSDDDFDFSSFRKCRTALFIKFGQSGNDSWTYPLLSLFYGEFLNYLLETHLESTDLPVFMLMDEFSNMRKIPNFQKIISLVRSQKVSLSIVVQNLSQINHTYGEQVTQTIIANTSSVVAYPGIKDKPTLDMIQGLLGKTTIQTKGGGMMSADTMTKGQIRTMRNGTGLFFHDNKYGEKILTLPIYENKQLMKRVRLYSSYGQLYPIIDPEYTENLTTTDGVSYIPFDEKGLDLENLELQQKLDEILVNAGVTV